MRWLACVLVLGAVGVPLGVASQLIPLASPPDDQAAVGISEEAVRAVVAEYGRLEAAGLLPVAGGGGVPEVAGAGSAQYGSVELFGVDVPLIVLAKLALVIMLIATGGKESVAEALDALVEGEVFPIGPREDEMANILHMTAGTAIASFRGDVYGELNFAQARLPDGGVSTTVVTGEVRGLPPGQYLLQLHQGGDTRDACSRLGPLYNPPLSGSEGVLGPLVVGASGRGSALLSSSASLDGPASVYGRSVAIVPAASAQQPPAATACAAIARQ